MGEMSAADRFAWGEMTEDELKSAYNSEYEKYKISSTRPGPDGVIRKAGIFPSYEEWKSHKLEIYRMTNTAKMEGVMKVIAAAPEEKRQELVKEVANRVIEVAKAPVQEKGQMESNMITDIESKAEVILKSEEEKKKSSWGVMALFGGAIALPFIFK